MDDQRDYEEEAENKRLMMEEDCDCSNLYLCSHSSFVTNPPGVEAENADICPDCDNEGCIECDSLVITEEEEDWLGLQDTSDGYGNTYPSYDAQMYYSEG